MKAQDIINLLKKYTTDGVLTLSDEVAGQFYSARIAALLTGEFAGTLRVILNDPKEYSEDDDYVVYPNAQLDRQSMLFCPNPKTKLQTRLRIYTSSTDDLLDMQLSVTMPQGWTLPWSNQEQDNTTTKQATLVIDSSTYTEDSNSNSATINFNNLAISAIYDISNKTITLSVTSSVPFGIDTIISLFGLSDALEKLIPPKIDLNLTQFTGSYDLHSDNETVMLSCTSATWGNGKAVIVLWKSQGSWERFIGIGVPSDLSLTDLPVIGKIAGALTGEVKLTNIRFMINDGLTPQEALSLAGKIQSLGTDYPTPSLGGMTAGFALGLAFAANTQKTDLVFPLRTPASEDTATAIQQRNLDSGVVVAPDGSQWISVLKSFGAISIEKVGISYTVDQLNVTMNASLTASGMTISLRGIGIKTSLTQFMPLFTLDGVGIAMMEEGIGFVGGLAGKIDPLDLTGMFALNLEKYQFGALAGYTTTNNNEPSLFVYGLAHGTLATLGFITLTSVAGGGGFNRKLVVPKVDSISNYPLVQWAAQPLLAPDALVTANTSAEKIGDLIADALSTLSNSGAVVEQAGQNWVALGIGFTSFGILDTFALLSVQFGKKTEIDLMGLATLNIPPDGDPVAVTQLALKSTIEPDTGMWITGQLTRDTHVLSKDTKLTGGFALYYWWGGEHADEWILTLGGYNADFKVPDYYPQVPRLGIYWKVNDCLSITGGLYFAVNAKALMVGGYLHAVWQTWGGNIRAWFDLQLDALMLYTPISYKVYASIELGASVRIALLFTQITLSAHICIGIKVWGKPFSGLVNVDLSIISFTISFGDAAGKYKPVSWYGFMTLLQPGERQQQALISSGVGQQTTRPLLPAETASSVLQIVATNGLVKSLSSDNTTIWLVDSETFQLAVQTSIPLKTCSFNVLSVTWDADQPTQNTEFGVGPVGVTNEAFTSDLALSLTTNESSQFHATKILGNVSKALWEYIDVVDDVPQIGDPLNETTIGNILTGIVLVPYAEPPDETPQKIPLSNLQTTRDNQPQPFNWDTPVILNVDPFTNETVGSTITATLATANRPFLLAAMKRAGLNVEEQPDLRTLEGTNTYLLAPPALRYLGEVKL